MCTLLFDAGDGIKAMHDYGFIHCDVKPENMIVGTDGITQIGDLDLAIPANCLIETKFGTIQYFPPYEFENEEGLSSTKRDVYSFGCSCFRLFSKGKMYQYVVGVSNMILDIHTNPEYLKQLKQTLPSKIYEALRGCLEYEPKNRPEMAEVVPALQEYAVPRHVVLSFVIDNGLVPEKLRHALGCPPEVPPEKIDYDAYSYFM